MSQTERPARAGPGAGFSVQSSSPRRLLANGELLGQGVRAEVYRGPVAVPATALKVFRTTTSIASIEGEIDALSRVSHRHLLSLTDVVPDALGAPCLLLPGLGGATLSSVLSLSVGLRPGQVVTALAPIAFALAELHRAGVSHGAIRADAIHFDAVDAPVLIGFGHARFRGESDGAAPAVLDDLQRLSGLAIMTLRRIRSDERHRAFFDLLDWLESLPAISANETMPTNFAVELGEGLFRMARPRAVRTGRHEVSASVIASPPPVSEALRMLAPEPIQKTPELSASALSPAPAPAPSTDPQFRAVADRQAFTRAEARLQVSAERTAARHARPLRGKAFTHTLREVVTLVSKSVRASVDGNPFAALKERIVISLRPVRKSFWIASGLGLVALVLAIGVVPFLGGQTDASGSASPVSSASALPGTSTVPSTAPPTSTSPSIAAPTATAPTATAPPVAVAPSSNAAASAATLATAIAGDDPLSAGTALIAARARCLAARSQSCLAGVDQPGSAAVAADLAVLSKYGGSTIPVGVTFEVATVALVQSLGGSALLSVALSDAGPNAQPASLLIVRSEAGWSIRDLELSN